MARRPKRGATSAPQATTEVTVSVPAASELSIKDLSKLSDTEFDEIVQKAKKSTVRYIILNAPFKVRSVVPVS